MYKTEQEEFWAGEFGDHYIERNMNKDLLASNCAFFTKVFSHIGGVHSLIEFGANIGMNLQAIQTVIPSIKDISAIEINKKAASYLVDNGIVGKVYNESILDFEPDYRRDMVLIKGVLIHINPDELRNVYAKLYETTERYLCVAEYYNPSPVMISYRGNENKLFKRDFAGEIMDIYEDLRLVDYGFAYHRDNNYPQDDITWFMMRKENK